MNAGGTFKTDGNAPDVLDARTRIIGAASDLFQLNGFRRTSMDAIAGAARMSKRTLYGNFADKHAVLAAVLEHFIARRFDEISQLSLESGSSRAELSAIARGLVSASTDAATMAMYRVLIAESDHLPALSERANRQGLDQAIALVREPLANLGVADCATAGRVFYDLLVMAPLHRRLVGAAEEDIDIEKIVDLILRGMSQP